MAKKSQVNRDAHREALIHKYADRRAELRRRLKDPEVSVEEKLQIQEQFAKLPNNSCPTRKTRRCRITGRSHAVYRKFGLSRIMLREMALRGELPGVRKSSW
ncbi:MAG: 30S ribosomal protein S14 [Myxococcota bacterium]|nr:30S ribosomal protein S14 [Myxococcota bacterium]